MQQLESLTREAVSLAGGGRSVIPILTAKEAEVGRQMQICNSCRYCEGFCAVFPAMTRRLEFGKADIHFLANLCHNCGACLHACQYAPPHEFAVNVPKAMAEVRGQTYVDYAWPAALGKLYQRNGLTLSVALAAALALFLIMAVAMNGTLWSAQLGGNFYKLFPHNLLVGMFAPVFIFATFALAMGVRRFWLDITPATSGAPLDGPAAAEATDAVLRLKYLGGGHGEGCHQRCHALSLCLWLGRAVRTAQSAQAAGRGRWRKPDGRHSRPVAPEPQTPSFARRPGAKADGSGFHRLAVSYQCERPGPVAWAGHACARLAVVPASGCCDGPVCHAALWQVCARHFPHRVAVASCD